MLYASVSDGPVEWVSLGTGVVGQQSGQFTSGLFRVVWLIVGLLMVLVAGLGVVLPLLPTTPFVLAAAFAFARSSRRWSVWLHTHPVFGPLIHNWQQHGAISRRAKILAVASMAAVLTLSLALGVRPLVLGIQVVVLSASAAFVLSRPSPPKQ